MHPHYPIYYHHRGPRRLFWFVLGGAAATLWIKWHERAREGHLGPSHGWWNTRRLGNHGENLVDERERFARIGTRATETMADASEAALDTIITSVQALKEKLAEQRTARQGTVDEHREHEDRPSV